MSPSAFPPSTGTRPVETEAVRVLLRESCSAVLEQWPEDGPRSRQQVARELASIRKWVEDGRPPGEGDELGGVGDRLLLRRLADALRIELLERWSTGPGDVPPERYLDLLAALDGLWRDTLPRDARSFASRLADPDGFELLVEVAHDLRSPLTSVSFLAETLRNGNSGAVNDLQRSQLGLIYSAAVGMATVVEDVVELARHGADLIEDEPAPFSIAESISSVERLIRPMAEEKGVAFRSEVSTHDRVLGPGSAVSRVLLNLVTNALKFTDEGWVLVQARSADVRKVEFSVRDTGRGIADEDRVNLFQPFVKSSERRGSFFSGSGLGLSIARRLVRAMGGELEYETRPGWGTRFFFVIELPAVSRY